MVFLSKIPRHAARLAHEKLNPLLFDTLSINEYPKSGGTWVCRMLRDATGFRFDDNAIPRPGASIVKYHRLPLKVARMAVVVRDPRDVFVSFYHHCKAVFADDPFNSQLVSRINREIFEKYPDEQERIDAFVNRLIDDPIYPRFTWHAFYAHFSAAEVPVFRYEDFRANPAETLGRLLSTFKVSVTPERLEQVTQAHSIDAILAARGNNEDAHFIRRGAVGGYADTLAARTIERINESEGAVMRAFGYL